MIRPFMLRNSINIAKKKLEALRAKDEDFKKRESELTQVITEAAELEGDEAVEAQKAIEEEVEKFDSEQKAHEEAKKSLEDEIAEMEKQLAEAEKEQDTTPVKTVVTDNEERTGKKVMSTVSKRNRFFDGKNVDEIFAREDVKAYLAEIRAVIKNKRELTNVGLTIPETFIGLIKENVENYSKLYRHVNVQPISGNAREIVQGTVAEAIWTECCAALNELNLAFNDAEIDCYKVAGYYKVCNAVLEDNDVDLTTKLLEALSQAIGFAVDKAILYGRNTSGAQKMPLGIVSRLAQTVEPSNYPATARPWADLHTTNIISLPAGLTGIALFKQITLASGAAKSRYSRGRKVWVMNDTTYTKLRAEGMTQNANGQIVSGVDGEMPVVGGIVEVLDFIPDNTIIGGYFDLYLLGERAGAKFAQSEHAFFIQDQTVFRGTARYDGQPVIAEGFVAIGLEGTTPSATSVAFEPDSANIVKGILLSQSAVTLAVGAKATVTATTLPIKGDVTWTSSDATKATVANGEITGVASGNAIVTAVSGSASASVSVTVTV